MDGIQERPKGRPRGPNALRTPDDVRAFAASVARKLKKPEVDEKGRKKPMSPLKANAIAALLNVVLKAYEKGSEAERMRELEQAVVQLRAETAQLRRERETS